MTDIGRAGIVMKGNYNSASTYETLDAVSYSNALYIAKQDVPAGTVPTNTTYWQKAIDGASFLNMFNDGQITSDTIDDYTSDGVYHGFFDNSIYSGVTNSWGLLLVSRHSAGVIEQIIFTSKGLLYRHYENTVWWGWAYINFSPVNP